jgi:hypothetical protein
MKSDAFVGFRDKREVIAKFDDWASRRGLNRSNGLRQAIRETLKREV